MLGGTAEILQQVGGVIYFNENEKEKQQHLG